MFRSVIQSKSFLYDMKLKNVYISGYPTSKFPMHAVGYIATFVSVFLITVILHITINSPVRRFYYGLVP